MFDSIRVPGHQFEIPGQENEVPAYTIETSDPRINDGEINNVGDVLACGDAGICKSKWKLTDSEPEATVVVCAWQDEPDKRPLLARVDGCVIYLYARLFNTRRYKASLHDIEVKEGTQVEEFLSSRPGVLMNEVAHDDDGLDGKACNCPRHYIFS